MTYKKDNHFIQFDGGETSFPHKISQAKVHSNLNSSSKFVYLLLKYLKDRVERKNHSFDPSYTFMRKRFGVSADTYTAALKQLSEAGALEYCVVKSGGLDKLSIKLLLNDQKEVDRIPSVIISTEVLTISQKVFLSLVWKLLYVDALNHSIETYYSSYALAKSMKDWGVSRAAVYKRIEDFSDPNSGIVQIIDKREDGGFKFKIEFIHALWEYEDKLWARFRLLGGKKVDYPVYKKPKPGDFSFDGKKIIKNI